jgi:hypothetical protein
MFPSDFVKKHLTTSNGRGIVFDPFAGRGTTLLEALLAGREAYGTDVNPVAVCISRAKISPPKFQDVIERIDELERQFDPRKGKLSSLKYPDFFQACFAKRTLRQLLLLRDKLRWKTNGVDCFIAALVLGSLHGESHKSPNYFSNRMPRTISTKPNYSVQWWLKHGLTPPERDVFAILRGMAAFRFTDPHPSLNGKVEFADARNAAEVFQDLHGRVNLVITSPPYLDITDYREDQWLRLWFLGDETDIRETSDDRHRQPTKYWQFLKECWVGLYPLLADDAKLVVRIGGKDSSSDAIRENLLAGMRAAFPQSTTELLDEGLTTAIGHGQLKSFNPQRQGIRVEHDFRFSVRVSALVS